MVRLAEPPTPLAGDRKSLVRAETGQLLKLAGPVALARLGVMTMGLMDAVVVGRYSAAELGFHALAWAPTSVVLTMAIGLLSGVQVMTARAIGEGRMAETGAVLRRGVVYGFWVGLAGMAVLALGGPPGLHAVGLDKALADGASAPTVIFALSLPAYVIACAFTFWLEALSKPTTAMLIMWAANAVNLLLLLMFVPGGFGVPPGAVGAGWATFGARMFLLAGLVAYVVSLKEAKALGVFARPPRQPALAAEQRRVGYGAGASNFFEIAAFASLNIIAGWISGLAVAAWAIVLNVAAMVFMIPLGLAAATSVLVAKAYGSRDPSGVIRAGLIGFSATAVFGLAVSLMVWPAAPLIAMAYTKNVAVIAIVAPALVLSCLFFLPDAMQVVVAQALRARGDVWVPTFTHMASYIGVMAPLAWGLAIPLGLGVNGLVWAVIVASLLSAGLLLARFWALSRQRL